MSTIRVLHHIDVVSVDTLRDEFPQVEFVRVPTSGAIEAGIEGDILASTAFHCTRSDRDS